MSKDNALCQLVWHRTGPSYRVRIEEACDVGYLFQSVEK